MPAWFLNIQSQAVASLVVRHALLRCMHRPSPELSICLSAQVLVSLQVALNYRGNIGRHIEETRGTFRCGTVNFRARDGTLQRPVWGIRPFCVVTVKFRARDARTTHGDYRLVWGEPERAPIITNSTLSLIMYINPQLTVPLASKIIKIQTKYVQCMYGHSGHTTI